MPETRAPRRRQDVALAAYLQTLARAIKEERKPLSQADIAVQLGLGPSQFTQALHGTTASLEVAIAFAKERGITVEVLRERAHAWYAANRLDVAAREALAVCESPEEIEDLCRRIRALDRERNAARDSSSTPTGSDT